MKCYRKNGSDLGVEAHGQAEVLPSMKCYRKNGSDATTAPPTLSRSTLNEVLPKER